MDPASVRFPASVADMESANQASCAFGSRWMTGLKSITEGTLETRFDRIKETKLRTGSFSRWNVAAKANSS